MVEQPKIVILGAGPAGLGAAKQLAQRKKALVTVLEQNDYVGGNAASFNISGVQVDFGSHRHRRAKGVAGLIFESYRFIIFSKR